MADTTEILKRLELRTKAKGSSPQTFTPLLTPRQAQKMRDDSREAAAVAGGVSDFAGNGDYDEFDHMIDSWGETEVPTSDNIEDTQLPAPMPPSPQLPQLSQLPEPTSLFQGKQCTAAEIIRRLLPHVGPEVMGDFLVELRRACGVSTDSSMILVEKLEGVKFQSADKVRAILVGATSLSFALGLKFAIDIHAEHAET